MKSVMLAVFVFLALGLKTDRSYSQTGFHDDVRTPRGPYFGHDIGNG